MNPVRSLRLQIICTWVSRIEYQCSYIKGEHCADHQRASTQIQSIHCTA